VEGLKPRVRGGVISGRILGEGFEQAASDEIEVDGPGAFHVQFERRERTSRRVMKSCQPPLAAAERVALRAGGPPSGADPYTDRCSPTGLDRIV
jgi:hypothetical protein